ncbi:MAG: NADPH-dependent FMN reductase, partial [Gaiellaceae bacterium]
PNLWPRPLVVRVLAVSGSLRAGSHNTQLLRAAAEAAPEGVELELWDGLADLPLYDQDLDAGDPPAAVRRLREEWGATDAILFATPEYNGSVPGGLKNAVDWGSRPRLEAPLTNKTVAVVSASTGQFGAMWAQADLRRILGIAGARVVGDELPVTRAHEKFDAAGRLTDGELSERLRLVLETLALAALPVLTAA